MTETFGGLTPTYPDVRPGNVTGELRSAELGRLGIFDIRGTPQVLHRTTSSVKESPLDFVKVCLSRSGSLTVHQAETEVRITPGEMALYDTGRPYDLLFSGNWACSVMTVPRDALKLPWAVVKNAMARSITATHGPASVLRYLIDEGIQADPQKGEPSVLTGLGSEAGLRLLEGALNAPTGSDLETDSEAELDWNRSVIRSWIIDHAGVPGLSHDDIARVHHMSPRSLHRLFEAEEQSPTQLLRQGRLAGARADLRDPAHQHLTIMGVASRWGFTDQAHFTRTFRKAFGTAPAAFRDDDDA